MMQWELGHNNLSSEQATKSQPNSSYCVMFLKGWENTLFTSWNQYKLTHSRDWVVSVQTHSIPTFQHCSMPIFPALYSVQTCTLFQQCSMPSCSFAWSKCSQFWITMLVGPSWSMGRGLLLYNPIRYRSYGLKVHLLRSIDCLHVTVQYMTYTGRVHCSMQSFAIISQELVSSEDGC